MIELENLTADFKRDTELLEPGRPHRIDPGVEVIDV